MTYGYHVGWITLVPEYALRAWHVFLVAPAAEMWDAGPPHYFLPHDDDVVHGMDGLEFV